MKQKLNDLIINLLAKSQVLADLPAGTMAKIDEAFSGIEISNDVFIKADSNLVSMDEAKKSPEMFKYYTDFIEGNFNKEFDEALKSYKFDEGTILEIRSGSSMGKRATLLASRAQMAQDGRYNAVELQKRIEELMQSQKKTTQFGDELEQQISEQRKLYDKQNNVGNNQNADYARREAELLANPFGRK